MTEQDLRIQTLKAENKRLAEELEEYKKLEEQGLLLKLPCKVGDKVYVLVPMVSKESTYREKIVSRFEICTDSIWICFKNGLAKDIKQIGKTVFLTEQEAQSALEKMNGDKTKQYVLVSQGIEIYRTTDKEEAERMMNESNAKHYEYLQRCADEGERPADNMVYMHVEE